MRIIYNQKNIGDFSTLTDDPSISEASSYWGKEGLFLKSAVDLRIFKTPFGSISLLYGPRQIGKTASLKLFLSRLRDDDSETVIFTDCSTILHRSDLYDHLSKLIAGRTTLVLDEVQEVADWHLALRTLYSEGRLKNCRIWCTGSEARYLLESGERLPGRRGEGRNVFARPWSFREFMDFFHPDFSEPYRTIQFGHVTQSWLDEQKADWADPWKDYLTCGGIPHAVGSFMTKQQIPDSIWAVYVDWILGSWSTVRTPERSLASLAKRLIVTMTSRVSYETLKKGTDIQSANTVKALMDLQEDHFSVRILPRYDLQREKFPPAKLKKIYPIDPFTARIWSAIGSQVRRLYDETVPSVPLDECAFATQMLRSEGNDAASYLYSETSKSEIDFYFQGCGFELKSGGKPTLKQKEILRQCPQSFVLTQKTLPLMSYLVGEGRR